MADTVAVEREIRATPAEVQAMVADITRMPQWSPENVEGRWLGGADCAAVGARFAGANRNGSRTWTTVCTVIESEPARAFAFRVNVGPLAISEWRYTFEPTPGGTRVVERWTDRRSALVRAVSPLITGVRERPGHNRRTMERTLAALAAAAEG